MVKQENVFLFVPNLIGKCFTFCLQCIYRLIFNKYLMVSMSINTIIYPLNFKTYKNLNLPIHKKIKNDQI
jgi:hypothetical protein